MADVPLLSTTVSAGLNKLYKDEIEKTANRALGILKVVKIIRGGGGGVFWEAEDAAADSASEVFVDGAVVANTGVDVASQATLGWGLRRNNFKIGTHAIRIAKNANGPSGYKNLVLNKSKDAAASLASKLNIDCFVTSAGSMIGLDQAVAATGTYATLNHATTFWQSYVVDPGSATTLLASAVRKDLAQIKKNSGERPDFAWCGVDTFNVVRALFDGNRREVRSLTGARGAVVLDDSVEAVVIDNCMFLEDKDLTESQIEYTNSNYMHMEVVPFDPDVAKAIPDDGGFGNLLLGMEFRELGSLGAYRLFTMEANAQLVVRNPRKFGRRLNIAV